jgi:uncharacterized protein
MKPINLRIAEELGVREQQVAAAISLLDGGATVPFVARYRKEATGELDDAQLRTLEERLRYLRELDERRAAILDSIGQQGKLDAALKQEIDAADSKARLEDLYLPYRPKRRTKAQIAREAGLEPLAEALLARPDQCPEQVAGRYVEPSKGVIDSGAALEGARAILVERFTEDATLMGSLREEVWSRGYLRSRVRTGKVEPGAKFADYFEFSEPLAKLPSHRILALFRGEKEEVLTLELVPAPDRGEPGAFERQIANRFKIADHGRPGDRWLIDTVGWPGGRGSWLTSKATCAFGSGKLRKMPQCRCSPGTCATCCSQPPRARVRQWGLIRGIGRASKSPWSPGPGKSPRRRQSTRMSHSVVGTSRLLSWHGLPESIGWS